VGQIEQIGPPHHQQDKVGAQQQRQSNIGPGAHCPAPGTDHHAPHPDAEPDPHREKQTRRWLGNQQIRIEMQQQPQTRQCHDQHIRRI
jgi:hypothetical protein